MHVCLDVGYAPEGAIAACVGFDDWSDAESAQALTTFIPEVRDYVPGEFYKRELPCLLAVLEKLSEYPATLIVDGHVHLDDGGRAGLGSHLYDAIDKRCPVIGVAKSSFHGLTDAIEVSRGDSMRPLYVTAIGMPAEDAAAKIQLMHGAHRIPTLLRLVDQLSRGMTLDA